MTTRTSRVAVLGTGMMGPGIGVTLALAGHSTALFARSQPSLDRGLQAVDRALDQLRGGKLISGRQAQAARKRISGSTSLADTVSDAAFVFESVAEVLQVKQALFEQLEGLVAEGAVLASNTSGLPITAIAASMKRPERAATAHFWNPPHLMPLVEVVQGERTGEDTVQRLRAVLEEAGKRVVVVRKDVPGQLGNRLLHALFREAYHIVQEGIASVEDVDLALKNGPGLRFPAYGLLEHADMVGLDMQLQIEGYLFPSLSAATEVVPFIHELVAQGKRGASSGAGLYDWSKRDPAAVRAARDRFVLERVRESRRPK